MTGARSVLIALAAICLPVATALGGCATGGGEDESARLGGSIEVGMSELPAELDPAVVVDREALSALWLVYTPLLTYRRAEGSDGTEIVPGLARALPDVSEDGLVYKLRLRRGLRYSNGVPVRAGDLERTVNRVRALGRSTAALYDDIRSIDADARSGGDHHHPDAGRTRPSSTSSPFPRAPRCPRGTPAGKIQERPPPGVGPYRIADVRRGSFVLVRDAGLPAAGRCARLGGQDRHGSRRVARRPGATQVNNGTLDVMQEQPPASLLPELRSNYRGRYREDVTAATVALVPDPNVKPFADPEVRRAVGAAFDGETVARLYRGCWSPPAIFSRRR